MHQVYMLLLENGRFYVGSTEDLDRRYQEHLSGKGAKATRESPPVKILYTEDHPDRSSAIKRELQLKNWTHAKKLALAESRLDDLKHLARRRVR